MSDIDQPADGPSDSTSGKQRRDAAREKARLARQKQKRRQRTGRWALQGGLALVAVGIVVAVVLVITSSVRPAGPGPENMASDGIKIGADLQVVPSGALGPDEEPVPSETTATSDTVDIVVYLDYLCPICGQFEAVNNSYIEGLVSSGAATIEYHPVAILTNQSAGTRYSNRAANAAACVANYSPNSFFAVNAALFESQPEEGTRGLDDGQLKDLVTGVEGLQQSSRIEDCIDDEQFASWVTSATQRAVSQPLPNSDLQGLQGTPTVLVDGQRYDYSTPFTQQEFSNFVVAASSTSYSESGTETPVPGETTAPEPTPAPEETPAS